MLGSEGVGVVVDPQRDVGIYLEEARNQGLWIDHVIETHLHADFISGHRELAALTGAKIHIGAQGGAKFPHIAVKDGDQVEFGRCRLRFLETPGHTEESICILVTDLERSAEPWALLTGDTLFIGDVGRPDLSPVRTPQELAGLLYDSLHTKILTLPDAVEVYPAHGAGSLCGKKLSTERSSTIGMQRLANYALQPMSREEFVHLLTSELPERPGYFALDAEINREGAAPLSELPPLSMLSAPEALDRQQRGAIILDTRPAAQFGAAHIPGSIQIGLTGQYASWAGDLLGLGTELILVAEEREKVEESRMRLARVGIERVAGYIEDGIAGWIRDGLPVEQVPQISVQDLHQRLAEGVEPLQVVDVRQPGEWEGGRVAQAVHMPLGKLTRMLGDLDRQRPVAVYCRSGYRSSIACSLLRAAGFPEVMNVVGGFDAWLACKLPYAQAAGA